MNNLKRIRVKVSVSMLKTCKRKKRRYRQIARLLYGYCSVMYMKRVSGEWIVDENINGAVKNLRDESLRG
jgi:hypothetical protein